MRAARGKRLMNIMALVLVNAVCGGIFRDRNRESGYVKVVTQYTS